jgi:hypothetical protein
MTRSRFLACVLAIIGLALAAAAPVQAEPTHWSYTSSADPNPVRPDNWSPTKTLDGLWFKGFTNPQDQVGSANILTLGIVAPPDAMTFTQKPFSLQLSILDKQSQHTGNLSFAGFFNGSIDPVGKTATITPSFLNATQTVTLGLNTYSVTISPFAPMSYTTLSPTDVGPGSGGSSAFIGGLHAQVDVSPAFGSSTPEPTGLALAGMGLVTVAGAFWRRRRALA